MKKIITYLIIFIISSFIISTKSMSAESGNKSHLLPTNFITKGSINDSMGIVVDFLANSGDANVWAFDGNTGQIVTIKMNSDSFDTYLFLVDPSGNIEILNDDGGTGSNSLISNYTLMRSGGYKIYAASWNANSSGNYSILTEGIPNGEVSSGTITISPPSGYFVTTQYFDLLLLIDTNDTNIILTNVTWNGNDVTTGFNSCAIQGTLSSGGKTFRCQNLSGGFLGNGIHSVSATVQFSNGSQAINSVEWIVIDSTEP